MIVHEPLAVPRPPSSRAPNAPNVRQLALDGLLDGLTRSAPRNLAVFDSGRAPLSRWAVPRASPRPVAYPPLWRTACAE